MSKTKVVKVQLFNIHIGTVIAVLLSWSVNKSILWCLLHGLFGWLYVIYHAIVHGVSI
jgi:hypothetical protein